MKSVEYRVSRKMRDARELAGLSQYELASLMGITQPTVSYYERGKGLPTVKYILSLSIILDLEPGGFLPTLKSLRKEGFSAKKSG